ncbi:MAG: sulfite exporter TauE/SafE family protein [Pseudomonadales bacterium]|nr:sulfite exporter TauE/SafE family protein [Pseudomonadales bacterium]NRA18447.1 sulfite exporter TauE/SafE family protein [Oceanospirillaceae bacterium]
MTTALLIMLGAGLITGFSKFSVGGMGLLILPVIMIAFPGPQALGIILPMYIITDVLAVISYRKNIHWPLIARLLPVCLFGVVLGGWLLASINPGQFSWLLGLMIVSMLVLGVVLDNTKSNLMRHPVSGYLTSLLGGFVSLTSNAAGPIFSLYFMEQKLSKETYISTRAWAFLLLNFAKVPMLFALGLLSIESTIISLQSIPGLVIGACIGYWLLGKLKLIQFKWLIRIMASLAAIKLLLVG